jgi:hypothetical protein
MNELLEMLGKELLEPMLRMSDKIDGIPVLLCLRIMAIP